jgi:cell division protein FtsB
MKQHRPRGNRKRIVFMTVGGMVLFYLLVSFFLGERGVLRDVELRRERAALKKDVAGLRMENARLTEEVESLKTDQEHIERLAREQGLVKKGEIIYQYEDEK